MPPPPKPARTRQRRNKTTTAATLEAPPVTRPELPTRLSMKRCAAEVDRKSGCPLVADAHDLDHFAKYMVEPHAFVATNIGWHELTLAWWTAIWRSPMVEEWVDADNSGLIALAFLWDEFYRSGDPRLHAEARLATREFGLSPLSRRSLQWEIKRVEGDSPVKPPAVQKPPTRPRKARLRVLTA